jgi:IPT/TIG domain
MAQSSLTVTPPNPSPPTNMSFTGTSAPNPPNYQRNTYANPFNMDATGRPQSPYGVNPTPPPFFDDLAGGAAPSGPAFGGTASVLPAFKTNTAALTAGVSANDTGTGTTISTAATGAGGNGANSASGTYIGATSGLVPASTSIVAEGAGTEVVVQKIYGATAADFNPNTFLPYSGTGGGIAGATGTWQLVTCSCGPALAAPAVGNAPISATQNHASSLSPAGMTTLTSAGPTVASGGGTAPLTATGTNFTAQSVIWSNGIAYPTTFVSSTSITCTAAKKATSGTLPVFIVTGGVIQTATVNWTFT